MQGGARKAAMAGFFFFTKKRLDGAASVPRRPPRSSGRPDGFADHSSGYPRPSRAAGRFYARQRPLRRHPPLSRAADRKIERRRHGSRGRAPAAHRARQAGLTISPIIPPDTRAPPARQAGFMPGSDRCAAILVPSRARQAGFMAAATVAPPPAPLARASGRKIERCKRESRGRAPAVSDRRRGQGCRAARRIGADSVFLCDGGALYQERGRERRGGAGGDGRSGRAHGMGKRPSAGDGRTDDGGAGRGKRRKRKGERARADGAGRRGERARVEGGMQGPRKRSHDQGKAGVRGGGQREGSAGRCGRWMDARGRRTNGEERRPAGHKKRASALQNDPAGVRKKRALLLYKTTRRACAKIARPCFTKRPGGRVQK